MGMLGSLFRVHSAFVALKSLGRRQIYVILPVGILGETVQPSDNIERAGLVAISVNGETLFSWARDLRQCTEGIAPRLQVLNGSTASLETKVSNPDASGGLKSSSVDHVISVLREGLTSAGYQVAVLRPGECEDRDGGQQNAARHETGRMLSVRD